MNGKWKKIELILHFHKEQILKIKPSALRVKDQLVWLKNSSGEYSTRSGYLTIAEEKTELNPPNQPAAPEWLPNVWNIKTSEKIKVFIWKSLQNALPLGEQFAIRNIPVTTLCARCNEIKSVNQLLFMCPYASKVWSLAPLATNVNTINFLSFQEGWEEVRKLPSLPPVGAEAGTLAASIILFSLAIEKQSHL